MTAVVFDDATNSMTVTGSGTDNGNPVSFTLVGTATGPGGPGTLAITLSDGYSNAGEILSGSIQLS